MTKFIQKEIIIIIIIGLNRYGISLPIRCPMFFPPVSADTDTDPMRRHSAPMTVKINVGSLSLAEKLNDRNIRLRLSVKLNVGSFSLTAEVNDRIIGLRL